MQALKQNKDIVKEGSEPSHSDNDSLGKDQLNPDILNNDDNVFANGQPDSEDNEKSSLKGSSPLRNSVEKKSKGMGIFGKAGSKHVFFDRIRFVRESDGYEAVRRGRREREGDELE